MLEDRPETTRGFLLRSRLQDLAQHRLFPLGVMVVAMALVLPSLGAGLLIDDYHHKLFFSGSDSPAGLLDSPLDLFRFFDDDPGRSRQLQDLGLLPWWTSEGAKAAFWRPITSLTHWLDYTLWPDTPALMHAQSILWYGVLALVTALLYRRVSPTAAIAGVAALLFAFDHTHATPVSFLANRNAVVAATFGVLALLGHDRYRREHSKPMLLGALVLLAASLLSAEAGIATVAYLAAYALFLDRGPCKSRMGSMLPYLAVVVLWRLLWNGLDCGVENLGVYIDPLREPGRYAAAVKDRAPLLLLAQLLAPPSDITLMMPPSGTRILWLGALVFLALFTVLLIPLLRQDRVARFWALGTLLSILPISATFPSDRLLTFTSIGAMGLIAQFLAATFASNSGLRDLRPWRLGAVPLAYVFVLVHAVIAPPVLMARSSQPFGPQSFIQQMSLEPLDKAVETQDLIVVNPPLAFITGTSVFVWADEQTPFPRRLRLLASSLFRPVRVARPDVHTLVVRPHYGYYGWVFDALFRDPKDTFRPGDRVELAGMTVEIIEVTGDGRALEAAFIFPVPLEDPSLRWLQYGPNGFEPFTPPPIGQTAVLPAPPPPWDR
ncbi:MAG: hypothetical protein JSW27_17495 [Phycisphaerales bacterium]|nr:MAG: hypothetical protein JSW27_17495 [Phycisphaerales bacterium]